jgi:hypothetical protein
VSDINDCCGGYDSDTCSCTGGTASDELLVDLTADLTSHHIEGIATQAPELGEFKVPLISHIIGNLYVGGYLPGVRLPDGFRHVISLYQWGRYQLGPNTGRLEVEMYDSADLESSDKIEEVVDLACRALDSGPTLIHCQAGLNRSNLIAALTLRSYYGYSPEAAIALLRKQRAPHVLCNKTFERFILSLDEE